MKKVIFMANLLFGIYIFCPLSWAAEIQKKDAVAPITAAFLKLYADTNPEVSLGAMLVSAHARFENPAPLVAYIKKHRSKNENATERTIKNYASAWLQYGNSDADNLTFIEKFPETPEELKALFEFEGKFKSPPSSYLLEGLLIFACNSGDNKHNEAAKRKKNILENVIGDWGWIGTQLNSCEDAAGGK